MHADELPPDADAPASVAVRVLCAFAAKTGDLDLRFTPSPSAQEGIAGHRTVASRRSAHYQNEVALEGEYEELKVRGRADGYDPGQNCLEEVKTYRGDLSKQPANHRQLHWAQAKIYGWLMCRKLELEQINLALVYFDIVGEGETLLNQRFQAAELEGFFNQQCALFLGWARKEMQHREARNTAAQTAWNCAMRTRPDVPRPRTEPWHWPATDCASPCSYWSDPAPATSSTIRSRPR